MKHRTLDARLIPAELDHLETLMSWFPDLASAQRWGGPHIRFPFEPQRFIEDVQWGRWDSSSLVLSNNQLLAFGQVVERLERHHLGRLAVNPGYRSQGLGQCLVDQLLLDAQRKQPRAAASLLVYRDNLPAYHCYLKLGFVEAPHPIESYALPGVAFMVKNLSV